MSLERRKPLARGTKPLKRTELKRGEGQGLKRSEWKRKPPVTGVVRRTEPVGRDARTAKGRKASKPANDIPQATRDALEARSRGYCEARCARRCTGTAVHAHHRQRRRTKDHRLVNLLHLCRVCHDLIHKRVAWSYVLGYLVRSTERPEDRPVFCGGSLEVEPDPAHYTVDDVEPD